MSEISHRQIDANGISIHLAEIGEGPLVLFCHGFPESWYSWRHQLPAVAEAGFRAVAMDMRGYGRTTQPANIAEYTISHLIGDVVGVVNTLGAADAVVVGHDWGAPVAWWSALVRPDLFRAVAGMSVPYLPPIGALPAGVSMNDLMRMMAGDRDYYRLYFQEPGVAESEMDADPVRGMLGMLYSISGDIVSDGVHQSGWDGHFPAGERFIDQLVTPEHLPAWLTQADVDYYVAEISRAGFFGGINWYRNINAIPSVLAPFVGSTIRRPSFYIGGSLDLIAGNTPESIDAMKAALPDLRHCELLQGAGHWIQQERPTEVNTALVGFLRSLEA